MSQQPLSGTLLIHNGWVRESTTYKKGEDKIFYDGVTWFLNGEKISDTEYPTTILEAARFTANIPTIKTTK